MKRKIGRHEIVEITDIRMLSEGYYYITFNRNDHPQPGQFYMLWLPGIDEFPMSIAVAKTSERAVIVRVVGNGTRALATLDQGSKIGVRGPYGQGYKVNIANTSDCAVLVGGGSGIASLLYLASCIQDTDVQIFVGFRTDCEVIRLEDLIDLDSVSVHYATDDGSYGYGGFVTDIAIEHLKVITGKIYVGTCGPEPMMYKIYSFCNNKDIYLEASIERFMKCGLGICDSCTINGYKVCRHGPVFDIYHLRKMMDFGRYKRDETGRKISIL